MRVRMVAAFDFGMDSDDDEDDEDSDDSGEDKEQSFDEEEFSRAMREMMGLPPEHDVGLGQGSMADRIKDSKRVEEVESSEDEGDIEEVMKRVESRAQ